MPSLTRRGQALGGGFGQALGQAVAGVELGDPDWSTRSCSCTGAWGVGTAADLHEAIDWGRRR